MTELEKKAKVYRESRKDLQYFSEPYKKKIEKAYVDGAKENGVVWHDLRKNPEDLPKEVGNYIVCYLDTACERHTFELSFVDWFEDKHWIDEDNHNIESYDEGVIAWAEIPKFEEKEIEKVANKNIPKGCCGGCL